MLVDSCAGVGSAVPALSTARTASVCLPLLRPVKVATGPHGCQAPPSRLNSNDVARSELSTTVQVPAADRSVTAVVSGAGAGVGDGVVGSGSGSGVSDGCGLSDGCDDCDGSFCRGCEPPSFPLSGSSAPSDCGAAGSGLSEGSERVGAGAGFAASETLSEGLVRASRASPRSVGRSLRSDDMVSSAAASGYVVPWRSPGNDPAVTPSVPSVKSWPSTATRPTQAETPRAATAPAASPRRWVVTSRRRDSTVGAR